MEQLEEGKIYRFYVEKLLSLPDANYYILIDDWNRKYLLTAEYYSDYSIKLNNYINCYVNKINCNGKIFLEPLHPIYKIGEEDYFEIYQIEKRIKQKSKEPYYVALAKNSKTIKAAVLNYTDINHNHFPVFAKCKVIKFKKGEVLLQYIENK
ncbi:MAG TPA: hypothetical protein PKG63_07095 [Bacteroidales bacterium]|jgi:hypothetical protein|nr:hypothetical protein [Bacteroidales bacterium]HNV96223.1 hypothetical protein [Bacteroidales bacterium]HOU98621.1 hypothetical protein [Bacteroidales bacterium]